MPKRLLTQNLTRAALTAALASGELLTERKFDRKVLALPDVELAGEASEREELKPLFDLVWQSAGFTRHRTSMTRVIGSGLNGEAWAVV